MNILIFSWRAIGHPHAGGAELVTHQYSQMLLRQGHQVTVFTAYFKDASRKEVIDGVTIIRYGHEILGVHLAAFLWYGFVNKQRYDVIIDQFHGAPFFTPLYSRKKKLAFIHEVTREVWRFNQLPKPFSYLPSILGPLLEPFFFWPYRAVPFITVSQSTSQDLQKWHIPKEHIVVLQNGIELSHELPKLKKAKQKTIVFLGSLTKDKGIEDAIKAFQIMHEQKKDFRYWIIGRGEESYQKRLEGLVKQYGLSNVVTFFGFVSEKQKFALLAKAHILINPSVREGWGLVVTEAGAVGTPCVGYNVPGLRDSIVNNSTGILCTKNTPSKLAQDIIKVLDNPTLYNSLSANAKAASLKLTWEKLRNSNEKRLIELIMKE